MLRRTLGEAIHISTKMADGLWSTQADASQVEDALINLSINARDAMPTGGDLIIETANVNLDRQYTARHLEVTPGDYVMVSVSDTGIGMPGGMTGYELADIARQRQPRLKILLSPGYSGPQKPGGGKPRVGAQVLYKPYRKQELAEKVRAVLDAPI